MKSAFLLASPQFRARLRQERMRKALGEIAAEEPLSEADRGHLHLAELLLTGVDRRELPEDEKIEALIA